MHARAKLLHKSKLVLNSGLAREVVIWKVPISRDYPEGIKYRFILVDPVWKKVLVLFDNHSPKGHHRHDGEGTEFPYVFLSVQSLLQDFDTFCNLEERSYENNED